MKSSMEPENDSPDESRPNAHLSAAVAVLVNGALGDPLLHLRLLHQRRSLLFDLGDASRLPARTLHQVSDVFVSHGHIDHFGGFLWLLRARIGLGEVCRLYGPPGLATLVDHAVCGILWDRIGDGGPRFEVSEVHGNMLRRFAVQAGKPGATALGEATLRDGVLLADTAFSVSTASLDHGTPVLAFAYAEHRQLNINKDALVASGLSPGRWLDALKRALHAQAPHAPIDLPDGTERSAGELAATLVIPRPGDKLVYATDLADSPDNRRSLQQLARDARVLFCEARFLEADREQAQKTQHLTARACGEIATAAGVERLIPFHFSQRYEDDPAPVYAEAQAACPRTVVPAPPT